MTNYLVYYTATRQEAMDIATKLNNAGIYAEVVDYKAHKVDWAVQVHDYPKAAKFLRIAGLKEKDVG